MVALQLPIATFEPTSPVVCRARIVKAKAISRVFDLISRAPAGLTSAQIVASSTLPRSTITKSLATLMRLGLVRATRHSGVRGYKYTPETPTPNGLRLN